MAIFAIHTPWTTKDGQPIWFPFETFDFPASEEGLDMLQFELNSGRVVKGYRLKIRRDGDNIVEVERDPYLITRRAYAHGGIMNENRIRRL